MDEGCARPGAGCDYSVEELFRAVKAIGIGVFGEITEDGWQFVRWRHAIGAERVHVGGSRPVSAEISRIIAQLTHEPTLEAS